MSQDSNEVVSVESNGRILSGAGADAGELEAVMDRHAPDEPTDTKTTSADSTITPSPKPDSSAATAEPEKLKKGRERYFALTNERKAAEDRATAAERERDELKARLSQTPAVAQAPSPASLPAPQPQPRVEPIATRAKPTEDEIGTKYANYADFVEDLADWKAEQRLSAFGDPNVRIRQILDQERAARTHADLVKASHDKGRAAYADFDTVLASGPGGQVQMPFDRLQAIYAAANTEHLQYTIMKSAELAQKLASMSPIEFGMELAKLSGAHQPTNGKAAAVSTAPAPFTPVGTGSKTTITPSSELANDAMDFDSSGYRERRAAERGVKPRRFGR